MPVQPHGQSSAFSCSVIEKHSCLRAEPHFKSKGVLREKGFANNQLFCVVHFEELLLAAVVGSHLERECDFRETVILHREKRNDFAKFLPCSVIH